MEEFWSGVGEGAGINVNHTRFCRLRASNGWDLDGDRPPVDECESG